MARRSYPYVCIDCGVREEKNRRFFLLDELLRLFRIHTSVGNNVLECLHSGLPGFQVGVMFQDKVLEDELPLRPEDAQADVSDDKEKMMPVHLSMYGVFRMMEKQLKLEPMTLINLILEVPEDSSFNLRLSEISNDQGPSDEEAAQILQMYTRFENALIPHLNTKLGNNDIRKNAGVQALDMLRLLAEADPSVQIDQESNQMKCLPEKAAVVYAAWTYKTDPISHVDVPVGLSIFDPNDPNDNKIHKCTESCCPYCHHPLPKNFGAYRQVTVGLLGGQSAGKTTYLAALADSLSQDIRMNNMPFFISRGDDEDPQWKRFRAQPNTQDGVGGPLWMYRNGYRVRKTELSKADAASLTFQVTPQNGEPILYVLADIAGEAFTGDRDVEAVQVAAQQKALLKNCDALFMVFSCDPSGLIVEAGDYILWMKGFTNENLIGSEVPAALLLTKADRIFEDSVPSKTELQSRSRLKLALQQLEKTEPVVNKVYNVEAMSSLCRLAFACADNLAPGLTSGLRGMLHAAAGGDEERIKMAAFPVCSGTDRYAEIGTAPDSQKERNDRYRAAKESRYGVLGPLMWLLALQGILPIGRGKSDILQYDDATNQKLQERFQKELFRPSEI